MLDVLSWLNSTWREVIWLKVIQLSVLGHLDQQELGVLGHQQETTERSLDEAKFVKDLETEVPSFVKRSYETT